MSASTLGTSSLPSGVTGPSGLHLNTEQVEFLRALRAKLDPSIPIYVTSATRSVREQASAMKTKRDLGDNLRKLYGSKVDPVLAVPNTVDAMAAALEKLVQQGVYMSRHMRGDAVDLRSRNWTPLSSSTSRSAPCSSVSPASTPPFGNVQT